MAKCAVCSFNDNGTGDMAHICKPALSSFGVSNYDEIESLRQRVADEKSVVFYQKEMSHTLREQLALRELEILKLRGGFDKLLTYAYGLLPPKHYAELLSTPLTTEHLNEWLRERIGEPVAFYDPTNFIRTTDKETLTERTPLYAVKEIV
jgi:hypothetical protein